MIRVGLMFCLLLLPFAAAAQQAPSPMEQALSVKISNEVSLGLQCHAALIGTQQELTRAQARIKALEEKYEPKKPE